VIGKFVVGENGPWNNVRSHMTLGFRCSSALTN